MISSFLTEYIGLRIAGVLARVITHLVVVALLVGLLGRLFFG